MTDTPYINSTTSCDMCKSTCNSKETNALCGTFFWEIPLPYYHCRHHCHHIHNNGHRPLCFFVYSVIIIVIIIIIIFTFMFFFILFYYFFKKRTSADTQIALDRGQVCRPPFDYLLSCHLCFYLSTRAICIKNTYCTLLVIPLHTSNFNPKRNLEQGFDVS